MCFEFALGHLPGHDDLEGPLAKGEFGKIVAGVAKIVRQQAVKLVTVPVEFFLQGDHLAPKRCRCHFVFGNLVGSRSRRLCNRLG